MSVLADKIRKSRESVVSVGDFKFTIRRPTDMDMVEYSRASNPNDFVKFVIGWEGVKELDLIPGGDGHPAKFDADACAEWLADRSDLFVPVVTAITDAYQAHKTRQGEIEKN